MWHLRECLIQHLEALADRAGGINVERRPIFARQLREGHIFAVQCGHTAARSEGCFQDHSDSENYAGRKSLSIFSTTTVSSSNRSQPSQNSRTPLKIASAICFADFWWFAATIFSMRARPKFSIARFAASLMPSLKNTNTSPGAT